MIVASPFGLQLNNNLQKSTPPFRDSYQTSIFLTTMFAVQCIERVDLCKESPQSAVKKWTDKPRLFEIGNHGAVDLSHYPYEETGVHPKPINNAESNIILYESYTYYMLGTLFLIALISFIVPKHYLLGVTTSGFLFIFVLLLCCFILFKIEIGSEPLSFTNGISSWPTTIIRFLAIFLVFIFMHRIYTQIEKNIQKIKIDYSLPSLNETKTPQMTVWQQLHIDSWRKVESKETVELSKLWLEFLSLSRIRNILLRALVLILLYFACMYLFNLFPNSNNYPIRGEFNQWLTELSRFWAMIFYFALVFVIVDISHLNSHFVSILKRPGVILSDKFLEEWCKENNIPKSAATDKILMDIIYESVNSVNKLIYYPFIVLVFLLLARNHYFDNWQLTLPLIIILGFTIFIACCSALRLIRAAKNARQKILERLNKIMLDINKDNNDDKSGKQLTQIKLLINQIENLKDGPFLPLAQHPIVLSWLIPFSSAGSVYILEKINFFSS